MARPENPTHLLQLQAVTDGTRPTTFSIDKQTREDLDFILDLYRSAVGVNPSLSVIFRRAVLVLLCHLSENALAAAEEMEKGEGDDGGGRKALEAFAKFVKQERRAIYAAAGRSEKRRGA
jgi:hypothetical protein